MSRFAAFVVLLSIVQWTPIHVAARPEKNLFPFPWLFPPEEPAPEPPTVEPPTIVPFEVPATYEGIEWFDVGNKPFHAAVLIAGSRGYSNYRHQADVCHAYRILRERGLPDERIITFVYDDIAKSPQNPYRGQIFNQPGGRDVYPGCAKDYTGRQVNADNVVAVLKGDSDAVKDVGSGRVLKADPNQRIFLFYSDHGSVGSIGMPTGSPLSARQLHRAFSYMLEQNFFKELVFYLESCESGSMFEGFGYEDEPKLLLVSASGAEENSWATYCDSGLLERTSPHPSEIGSCMGDLFSVSWMEFAETHDVGKVSIAEQLQYTEMRTSNRQTYYMGSHMQIYAKNNSDIQNEVMGNFLSYFNVPTGKTSADAVTEAAPAEEPAELGVAKIDDVPQSTHTTIKQRDADLVFLLKRATSNDYRIKEAANLELQETLKLRHEADRAIRAVVQTLMQEGKVTSGEVESYVETLFPRGASRQVVDDWDCFEESAMGWTGICGQTNSYALQYTRAFANLCNLGVARHDITRAMMYVCAANQPTT